MFLLVGHRHAADGQAVDGGSGGAGIYFLEIRSISGGGKVRANLHCPKYLMLIWIICGGNSGLIRQNICKTPAADANPLRPYRKFL